MPRWLLAAMAVTLTAAPLQATEPSPWTLQWAAPAGCPTVAQVRASVVRLLGDGRRARPDVALSVGVTVSRTQAGWHAELVTSEADLRGRRALDGATCSDVAEATALIVALLINPDALAARAPAASGVAAGSAPAPSPVTAGSTPAAGAAPGSERALPTPSLAPAPAPSRSVPVAAPAQPPAPPPPVPAPPVASAATVAASASPSPTETRVVAPPDSRSVARDRPAETGTPRARHWLTFGQVSGGLGTVPGAGFGVGLGAGARRGRWIAALAAAYWPPATTTVAAAGARVDLVAGDASACLAVVRAGALDLGPCVAFEMGRMHASSVRVSSTSDGASVWAAALAGAFASVGLGPSFGMTLHIDALVPVVSPQFQIDGFSAYQPAQVEGRATLCGEVRF